MSHVYHVGDVVVRAGGDAAHPMVYLGLHGCGEGDHEVGAHSFFIERKEVDQLVKVLLKCKAALPRKRKAS